MQALEVDIHMGLYFTAASGAYFTATSGAFSRKVYECSGRTCVHVLSYCICVFSVGGIFLSVCFVCLSLSFFGTRHCCSSSPLFWLMLATPASRVMEIGFIIISDSIKSNSHNHECY